ncbi:hypothetical protein BSL78_25747 [Apostichopus japonicus]|uniref:Uncharacterized protein n=1 Tax=Stichopus japonicus TaxID=307972 RepID=A0A2G8JNX8_STIJA|nr:hypothetical protein BSL78_25747 [Apostichopus japonicus]
MASRRDSRIAKLSFTGEQAVPPVQVFSFLKGNVEGMTVTPYERSVWVTIIHVGTRGAAGTCRNGFGSVGLSRLPKCAPMHRPLGVERAPTGSDRPEQDIPSFLFIAGHKAHVRYPGQPRTCFRCGRPGTKPRAAQTRNVGAAFVLGMIAPLAQTRLCAHYVGRRDMSFSLSLLLCL